MAITCAYGAPAGPLAEALGQASQAVTCFWSRPPAPIQLPRRVPRHQALEQASEEGSPWDPETPVERLEVGRCRALLLEVLRRAIHDWILYRNHSKLEMRQRAESAFIWLFLEGPGHAWWDQRRREGTTITAFLTICDLLDLDPGYVRRTAKKTTVKQIMTAGRPAERRRPQKEVQYAEHGVDDSVVNVDSLDALDAPRGSFNSDYEAYYAVSTPEYL
jgi:hypothetical protein